MRIDETRILQPNEIPEGARLRGYKSFHQQELKLESINIRYRAQGTLYETSSPAVIVRIVGQAPVGATVWELERVRCHLCGKVFTAPLPEEAGELKYDESVGTVIALLKYGSGLPFHRLQRLRSNFGIPLSASTQWDLVQSKAKSLQPVLKELILQAAQGDVVYNDDTNNKILGFMGKRAQKAAVEATAAASDPTESPADRSQPSETAKPPGDASPSSGNPSADNEQDSDRKGTFTSGIVSRREGRDIALFFTGRQHCGDNLRDVLLKRAKELSAPIQMCDGLSRNLPAELKTIVANCLAHGRRKFVDVVNYFEKECRHVIDAFQVIYKNDAEQFHLPLLFGHRFFSIPIRQSPTSPSCYQPDCTLRFLVLARVVAGGVRRQIVR